MKKLFALSIIILTLLGISSYAFAANQKELKVVDNNVYVYEGTKKLTQLTGMKELSCIKEHSCLAPQYTIIKSRWSFGLVKSTMGVEGGSSQMLLGYSFRKDAQLMDVGSLLLQKAKIGDGYWTIDAQETSSGMLISFTYGPMDGIKEKSITVAWGFFTRLLSILDAMEKFSQENGLGRTLYSSGL